MSNLEHLFENGISTLEREGLYEWQRIMSDDPNWEGNEHISMDELWTLCQYVVYVYRPWLIDEIEDIYEMEINV